MEEEEKEEKEEGRCTFYTKSRRSISSAALSELTSPEKTNLSAPTSKKPLPWSQEGLTHAANIKRHCEEKKKKRIEINFLLTFVQQVVPTFCCSSRDAKEGDLLLHEDVGKPEGQVYHQR